MDTYAELDRRYREFKPTLDRYEAVKKGLKRWFDNVAPEATGQAEGVLYRLNATARSLVSIANMKALWAELKRDRFLELVTITQKAVTEAPELGETWIAKLFTKTRTGSRELSVVLKAPAGEKAA